MAEKGFEPMFCFSTSKTLYSVFSRHLGSTALPLLPTHLVHVEGMQAHLSGCIF